MKRTKRPIRPFRNFWRKEQRFVRRHKSIHIGWVILSSAVLCLLIVGSVFALINPGEPLPLQPIVRTVQQGASSEEQKSVSAEQSKPTKPNTTAKTNPTPKAQPCVKASYSTAQPLAISTANAGLKTNVKTTTYDVFGNTVNEVRNQLSACTPFSPYDAYTSWYINWQYGFLYTEEDGCKLTDATVGVQVQHMYPKWQSSAGAENGLATKWQNYISKLTLHEEGHRSRYIQYGQKILSGLQTMPTQNDCSVLEQQANSKAGAFVEELKQIDAAYDDETGHGATQGAVFP